MIRRKKKIKEYELQYNDVDNGVEAISLVEKPAIEIDFMTFSKQKEQKVRFSISSEEKQILTGPALIPEKRIYRYDEELNEEYYVFFSAETIEKISQKYLINGNQSNVSLEHLIPVNGVILVESWIVKDPKKDKACALGFDVPAGTWMISMKVLDEKIWNEFVKTGIVRGFSIEGYFTQRLTVDKDNETLNKIKELLRQIED